MVLFVTMEEKNTPTIKGIFVNSHIRAVEKVQGAEGLRKLKEQYGGNLDYKNSEDVPVREEVKIIECALDILSPQIPPEERAFEAGKLHFRNFVTTPLAKIVFSMFRQNFKLMMMQSPNIAGHVFRGVHFSAEDLGPQSVRLTMTNNDYPIDHFRGLFAEWMEYSGCKGDISEAEIEPNTYQYTMEWK